MDKKCCKCGCSGDLEFTDEQKTFVLEVTREIGTELRQGLAKMSKCCEDLYRISNSLIREDYPEGLYHLGRVTQDLMDYVENSRFSPLEEDEESEDE